MTTAASTPQTVAVGFDKAANDQLAQVAVLTSDPSIMAAGDSTARHWPLAACLTAV